MVIHNLGDEDKLVWWRSRNGVYSVRSAYFGIMEDLTDSFHLRVPGNWMQIWRLKVPQRVKILLWRMARGCLPPQCNLARCHIPCEEECPMCTNGTESDLHLFFQCTQVVQVWSVTNFAAEVHRLMQQNNNFANCFFSC